MYQLGFSHVSVLNREIQYSSCLFLNNNFGLYSSAFLFVLLLLVTKLNNRGEKKDYIKSELIDGGSPTHLNTFKKFY